MTEVNDINWLAVLCAAISTFVIGGIWYNIFNKPWMKANGFQGPEPPKRNMALVFGISFVLSFVMALNLAFFIGGGTAAFGAMAGFLTGFGWVLAAIGIISLFESRPLSYVLINGGYMTVSFTVMGLIIGAWY